MKDDTRDNLQVQSKKEKDFIRLARLGHVLFNSVTGKEFIELLKDLYLYSPVSPYGATERYACVREGQNELVRLMINMRNFKEEETK